DVREHLAVADVERLVVDEQPDQLAVGDVDDRLAVLRVAVAGLRVGQRAGLVVAAEVGARERERLALVEVAAQPDVAVGEGEDRLRLRQPAEVEALLGHAPRLDGELLLDDHRSSSPRSSTTRVAPCAARSARCLASSRLTPMTTPKPPA